MDNFLYRDYAAWKIENLEIINKFMENDNPIYKRMEPIYLVLNHIYDLACLDEKVDEDYETVFEVGFNYLHSQFEVIKIYFQRSNFEEEIIVVDFGNNTQNKQQYNYVKDEPILRRMEQIVPKVFFLKTIRFWN